MANDINNVVLVGRLTRDSELKYTNSGTAVSNFSIAVNRRQKSGDQWSDIASFFDVTLWGTAAENLNQYLMKGKQIAVQGELRQNRWEQGGRNLSKVVINARVVELLGGKESGGGQQSTRQPSQSSSNTEFYGEDFDDDIPF